MIQIITLIICYLVNTTAPPSTRPESVSLKKNIENIFYILCCSQGWNIDVHFLIMLLLHIGVGRIGCSKPHPQPLWVKWVILSENVAIFYKIMVRPNLKSGDWLTLLVFTNFMKYAAGRVDSMHKHWRMQGVQWISAYDKLMGGCLVNPWCVNPLPTVQCTV